ncbi:MAG: valine--tRNA ligase, partial [Verrucomicrobiota bacterium]
IATTRPETIPGDTGVAVNPKDPRYARLVGKHVIRPLPAEYSREKKLIPIVADDHIDPQFGTGVLKVTPAHDKADFEIGQRHGLSAVDVMNPNATMNALAGKPLEGLDRFAAREKAVEQLKELGALVKEEPYENKVGFSQRARVPIEPRLSEQWFLKYPSVEASKTCVAEGRMKFHPDRWAKVYDHWMSNIQDWCISRQLWWGHRIPVWYRKNSKSRIQSSEAAHAPKESLQSDAQSAPHEYWCDIVPPPDPEHWEQDPDVLDTWCSSWLWPFATMGWTGDQEQDAKNATLQTFYPTTDLVTGPDIIFFWVARMIMAGYEYMGDLPFRNVYFTGIIRDKQGRKMSKMLGNSPDPLELISKYGADALRFGTMRSAPLGQDVLFDEKDVELGRNFCNKLWNACRFRQMQGGETEGEIRADLLTSDDKWILLRLDTAIREINEAFANYRFNEVTQTLYRFFWSEFCDWYLEASKASMGSKKVEGLMIEKVEASDNGVAAVPAATLQPLDPSATAAPARAANTLAVIDFILSHTLRLFHPFLPFITEELWHGLGFNKDLPGDQGGDTIMFAHWPKPLDDDFKEFYGLDESDERFVNAKYELVTLGRNLKAQLNLPANKKVRFVLKPGARLNEHEAAVLKILLNAETLEVTPEFAPPKGTPMASNALGELYLPLAGLIDPAAERARLTKELEKTRAEIAKVEAKLNNPNFTQKVPPQVLAEHQQRLKDWQAKEKQVLVALDNLPA